MHQNTARPGEGQADAADLDDLVDLDGLDRTPDTFEVVAYEDAEIDSEPGDESVGIEEDVPLELQVDAMGAPLNDSMTGGDQGMENAAERFGEG